MVDLPRKYIANIAVMFGIKPGHMGKKRLCNEISRKMRHIEEQSRREAMKSLSEKMGYIGAPCDNEDCPAHDGLTGQCEINCNCHLARQEGQDAE